MFRRLRQSRSEPETGDLHKKGCPSGLPSIPPTTPGGDPFEGVVTDQKLLAYYYSTFEGTSIQAIATDKFLEKSKSQYSAAWLAREILQNFVDHNEWDPNTLNGVSIEKSDLNPPETVFRIRGQWIFDDPTGLIAPHSDKPEDVVTAGGNGIGLKQVAMRYLRDFDVKDFTIQGEGWAIHYKLASKDKINTTLEGAGISHKVKHDWLIAELKQNKHTGSCLYEIRTESPEIIASLADLHTMGASDHNPYLSNPDFSNETWYYQMDYAGCSEHRRSIIHEWSSF